MHHLMHDMGRLARTACAVINVILMARAHHDDAWCRLSAYRLVDLYVCTLYLEPRPLSHGRDIHYTFSALDDTLQYG